MIYYVAFVCKKCGRAQATYFQENTTKEKKRCKCIVCRYSTKLFAAKNPVKVLLESYDLEKIKLVVKLYNANSNEMFYDYQKGESKQKWESEAKIYWD